MGNYKISLDVYIEYPATTADVKEMIQDMLSENYLYADNITVDVDLDKEEEE